MRPHHLAAALLLVVALAGCDAAGCLPTTMEAQEAALVDAGAPGQSAVLQARLLAAGAPIGGAVVEFEVRQPDDSWRLVGEAQTGGDGVARLELVEAPARLAAAATATAFRARFDGDASRCSSQDEAEVRPLAAG